jgi:ATP-dependent exoDNAse (exonuclease V) alpha subunit
MGNGAAAMELLTLAGAKWNTCVDTEFEGTTILPKNDQVNRYNMLGLDRIKAPLIAARSRTWGKQRREWEHIPEKLNLKIGALVMVLSNAKDFSFVNGDCGHVVEYDPDAEEFVINLKRTGQDIVIPRIVRGCDQPDEPEGWNGDRLMGDDDDGGWYPKPHLRAKSKRYVLGQIEYFPLRLAYASTVHKSQSLTLDNVQVDYRDWFFGHPSMLYVALSRCRSLDGLRLVGMKEKFVKQCQIDRRVLPWI